MKSQYITDKMNILKAPREKRQDTYKGLEMEYCVSQCNSGFQKKMKHCPQNSERKSCLLWNLPADKQKARSYHICKDPKFLFLILFLWKLIEDKVQEMRSYRREEKGRPRTSDLQGTYVATSLDFSKSIEDLGGKWSQ